MIARPETVDAVVIGGGISGLATAHWLQRLGVSVRALEKDPEPGGTMKTVREQEFLSERGPNSALETTPLISQLVRECGLENEFLHADPSGRNRYILRDGMLHALPLSPISFLTTPLFSMAAKLRLLKEPFIGKADKEESIAEFVRRRLGSEFLDYAIDPFVAGVYAARPDALSVRAAFPKLYALESRYGGLLRGMVLGRKERRARTERSKDRAESFSFRNGMQSLPVGLARGLGDRLLCSAHVTGITDRARDREDPETNGARYRIEFLHHDRTFELHARSVVIAVPAYTAAALLTGLSAPVSNVLGSIQYPPIASVFFGYRREDVGHPLNGFGFLVPSREQRTILGCLWSSSLFPGRAPEGHVGLTVFIGGSRQPDLASRDEQGLADMAADELKTLVQIRGKPVYWTCTKWPRAIPQYEVGYDRKMQALVEFEQDHPGIMLCGNYRGGIAVGDCIQSANDVAHRTVEYLRQLPER